MISMYEFDEEKPKQYIFYLQKMDTFVEDRPKMYT